MLTRTLRFLRPSHQHGAFSATLLMMTAIMLSRVIGYVREAYIAWAFGAGPQTDAYVAGFTIPDWLNYLVAGGTASITFVAIYTRSLAENKEKDAEKTFSIIITIMTAVLGSGTILAEVFTPHIERHLVKNFSSEQLELCVHLTRILLPAQIFFYVGGVVSAVLLSRRLFLLPAFGPLLYNVSIIAGGLLLSRRLGIASLAYGALMGSFLGPFLVNVIGAAAIGTGYRISFDFRNPAFREWVRLTIPLMIGVSLVTADDWILRYFASGNAGDITRLNYAKRLFSVPIAVLGQAIGQASLPFFARLFGEKRMEEFAQMVNASIYRIIATSVVASSLMAAASLPLIDLVYRRGRFQFSDSETTALYFWWFSLSLAFWSAQALYSRAFYAAGDTLTPMVASSLITLASIPMYSALYRAFSTVGLAMASDLGIVANTLAIAVLLDRRKLVRLHQFPLRELAKVTVTAVFAGILSFRIAQGMIRAESRARDLYALLLITCTWAAAVAAGLWLTSSQLPADLRRRRGTIYPRLAERQAEDLSRGAEP
jgi:putative peptidoglycan lipid II flippase